MRKQHNDREAELGAVKIKTILGLLVVAALLFSIVKVTPVYVEEQNVIREVDDLARRAANDGRFARERLQREIDKIHEKYSLSEGSITVTSHGQSKAEIAVNYSVPINLLVTTYAWQVDHTAVGRGF